MVMNCANSGTLNLCNASLDTIGNDGLIFLPYSQTTLEREVTYHKLKLPRSAGDIPKSRLNMLLCGFHDLKSRVAIAYMCLEKARLLRRSSSQ